MAVAGLDRPAPFWASERGCGYVGNDGEFVKAAQPRPIAVAKPKGIPYQAMPPNRYALTEVSGWEAMALCQYAWSSQTVLNPATSKSIAKTNPPVHAESDKR